MRLIQVIPRAGSGDGVGDYAACLADALRVRHGVASEFVAAGWSEARGPLARALETAAAGDALLLHYVGYGYARRGAPLWLARAMAGATRSFGSRLGAVFHELYATGRPWQSSFWLGGLQKHVVTRIAQCCRFALLTREASRQWLERTGALAGKPVSLLPISSNVGEPRDPPPLGERAPTMVVWGSARARAGLYANHASRLGAACRVLGLSRIVDIGLPAAPGSVDGVTVEELGPLPAGELSDALLAARCGVVVYPASFLAKSTIFAAYAAHGLVPLVLDEVRTAPMDGLAVGRHFLRLSGDALEGAGAPLQEIAQHARSWYAGHATDVHADAVWHLLAQERR